MPISHPNAKSYYFTLEYMHGGYSNVMVVETDLHLNVNHPGFDKAAVNSLLEAAQAFQVQEAPRVPNIRLVSVRKYDAKA